MLREHEVDLMKLFRVCGKYSRTTYGVSSLLCCECFVIAILCSVYLPATRPSSYRGHRAIRTIAIYTVTSAVTLPLMLPTKSLTSLIVCLSCQRLKKNKKKSETLPSTHRVLWQVISLHQHGLPWSVSVTALSGPLLAVFPCNRS